MESRGDVLSIKFSADKRILGVQRSQKSVVSTISYILSMIGSSVQYYEWYIPVCTCIIQKILICLPLPNVNFFKQIDKKKYGWIHVYECIKIVGYQEFLLNRIFN